MKNRTRSANDMRCCCGKLLGKLTREGIVIRCARCKREVDIDFSAIGPKLFFNSGEKLIPVDVKE